MRLYARWLIPNLWGCCLVVKILIFQNVHSTVASEHIIYNPIDYYIDQTPSGKRTRADWFWVSKLPSREKILFGTILLQEKNDK